MYKPINKENLSGGRCYESVIESIKSLIIRGELKCGSKLPSERELAEKFKVSRVPIREALKILEYMGVLDGTRGDGVYVQNTSVEAIISKMSFTLSVTSETVMDLLDLRIALEAFAASMAAQRRTAEDIADIRQVLLDMREAKKQPIQSDEDVQRLRGLSHQFHRCMVAAAHNSVLTSVYENLYELLDISRQFTIGTSGINYNSILAHEAVFNRIIEQDADGARQSMLEHLEDVRVTLHDSINDAEQEQADSEPAAI